MLLEHFGLREQPFGVTPNPRYLYLSPTHREALASLVYGIDSGRGFMALIASPGMGKTTLLVQLLQRLGSNARTVFLFQAQCGSRDLLRSIMADLGAATDTDDMVMLQSRLNQVLIEELQAGRKFVLVLDEAQNLDDSALEFVRMLSNFETSREKLMHIVLAGQTQLAEKLARPSMVQLRQRISIVVRLRPLGASETAEYIEHRLGVAGCSAGAIFSAGAMREIFTLSAGIPRNINNLCFNALSLAYASGRKRVESAIIREVMADLDLNSFAAEDRLVLSAFQPSGLPSAVVADLQAKPGTRTAGWAVLLDKISSPAERLHPPSAKVEAAEPWKPQSGWRATVGSIAGRLRDRVVH